MSCVAVVAGDAGIAIPMFDYWIDAVCGHDAGTRINDMNVVITLNTQQLLVLRSEETS